MKIKKYNDFVNEELTKDEKFILKNLPYILGNRLISHLLGAAPLLASKWQALKNKSKGEWSHYGGSSHNQIKRELTKIEISDLPDTPLKRGLYPLFNSWNIYKADEKSKGGNSGGPERPVIYISKDELKTGDYVVSSREGNWETEDAGTYKTKSGKTLRKLREPNENDPIFILSAKYDVDEFLHKDFIEDFKDIMNYDIEDIGLEVEETYTTLENDSISCEIKEKEGYGDLTLGQEIVNYVENNTKRAADVLKSQTGKEWIYSISFSTGNNQILKTNQVKIINHYQKEPNFWNDLSKYNLYSQERPEYLKKLYNSDDYKYALEEIFGQGRFKTIILVKNSKKIIETFDLENQKFNKIGVRIFLKKD
jgi:hypothetical protein